MAHEVTITIPEDAWSENPGIADGRNCLYATLIVNGLHMHLEAWEVHDDEGIQRAIAEEYEDSLGLLHEAISADGHFDTREIAGRTYVLVAFPFC